MSRGKNTEPPYQMLAIATSLTYESPFHPLRCSVLGEGYTIIMVTHDSSIAQLADRIIRFDHRRVVLANEMGNSSLAKDFE